MRIGLTAALAVLLTAGLAIGHHSYGDYDRNSPVALEGAVKQVLWANPHVVLTLDSESKGEYRVEWLALTQLARQGLDTSPMRPGDRVVITGSVNRNPERRILTLVREIRRQSDGWRWIDARYINAASQAR
jgi:hypothetical protein